MNVEAAASFAAVSVGLLIAHNVADHWVQTDGQARDEGLPGWPGRKACLAHVWSYTIVTVLTVSLLWAVFDLSITVWGFCAGQLISAASHYWADRRFTLARLCEFLGKGNFYRLGMPRKVEAQGYTLSSGKEVVRLFTSTDQLRSSLGEPAISWDNPSLGTGAYALDQSWHWFFLGLAAIATVMI
jgi:hypothetical protein